MTTTELEALRTKAGVQEKADAINRFRADFQIVWKMWIAERQETPGAYAEAGENVKRHMADAGWMVAAAAHFAKLADAIRSDQARSERIRAEARAARAMIDLEDGMRGGMA